MQEMIFFTPIDLEEYNSTNSAELLNHVVELNLTDQVEIVRQIALEAQNLVSFIAFKIQITFNFFSV
jgi:hypothetical protein